MGEGQSTSDHASPTDSSFPRMLSDVTVIDTSKNNISFVIMFLKIL